MPQSLTGLQQTSSTRPLCSTTTNLSNSGNIHFMESLIWSSTSCSQTHKKLIGLHSYLIAHWSIAWSEDNSLAIDNLCTQNPTFPYSTWDFISAIFKQALTKSEIIPWLQGSPSMAQFLPTARKWYLCLQVNWTTNDCFNDVVNSGDEQPLKTIISTRQAFQMITFKRLWNTSPCQRK